MSRWLKASRLAVLPWLVLLAAPLMEKGAGQQEAHVEALGTATHVAHHHDDCISCTSPRGLGFLPERPAVPGVASVVEPTGVQTTEVNEGLRRYLDAPRAPPALA